MRFDNATYDVVLELNYPLGASSDLAYDTWGRELGSRVAELGARAVRCGDRLLMSRRVAGVTELGQLLTAVRELLERVASQVCDVKVDLQWVGSEPSRSASEPFLFDESAAGELS